MPKKTKKLEAYSFVSFWKILFTNSKYTYFKKKMWWTTYLAKVQNLFSKSVGEIKFSYFYEKIIFGNNFYYL